jgi:autotransporter-associated beta strand protein
MIPADTRIERSGFQTNGLARRISKNNRAREIKPQSMGPFAAELTSRKFPARKPGWRCLVGCAAASWLFGSALGAEVDITPISTADGIYSQVAVGGQTAWQNTGTSRYLYGRRPNSFAFTAGQTLYVRVTYFDDLEGTVDLQFDAQTSNSKNSTLTTRTSRVNSGRFVDGFFELPDVRFNKSLNGSDFRIICGTTDGAKVPVQRITLSDTPFANADFQLAVSRAWQTRYTGPAKDYVDATTLTGKVMTGYQGWFGTPNDIADTGGWKHWSRSSAMIPENFTIDAWPDLTEYDPSTLIRAANVVTRDGAPAYLFSSRSYPAVKQHFRWMRKHNIDGAWLQRFHPKAGAESEWVLRNVSQAAAEEGLIWGVEYDVSGMADSTVAAKLQADWEWLTTQFDLLNDPRYVRENGKPVVFIWGLAVPDRDFTTASANAAVDYFQAQGAYVIGGLPTNWNSLNAGWQAHMAKYDGVLVWQNTTTSDAAFFRNRGQDFFPHVWPGFSWANLKQQPANPPVQYTDRQGGQFYWNKGRDWINAGGADRLFIGMFDEYDEATHIMPMTDDPPDPSAAYGRFIDNQGKPSDWWMMLTDELKRMMFGQRTNTGTLPTVDSLENRSNIGAEAFVDFGMTDINTALSRVQQADGNTTVETVGGKECRGNTTPATDRYLYFDVNNTFAYQLLNGDVTIEVEYYDNSGSTVLGLQYDGAGASYNNHPLPITTTGSNTWRTVRFEIADAYFGGRQNGSSDFRLTFGGKKLNINRVWVRLPEGKAHPFAWTNAAAGPALTWSQNANWLGGIVAQSNPTSTVRFFPGQTMPGGTIPISNNIAGQQFGTVHLGGTASSSSDTTVTLSGNGLSLGGSAPTITLDAIKTAFDLTYDIATPVTLLGTTEISGAGDANLRISGPLSGSGGLTKSSPGTLALTESSSYSGPTTVSAGSLEIGGSGRLGNGAYAGAISIASGAVLRHKSSTAQTLSGSISGEGSLVKDSGAQLTLSGANGSFSGGVTIRNGTLRSATTTTTLGAGTVTMGGGGSSGATFITGQSNSNAFAINAPDSGPVVIGADGNGSGFTLNGPVILNGDLTFQTFNNPVPTPPATTKAVAILAGGLTGTGDLLLNNSGLAANTIELKTNAINHAGTITLQGTATGNTTINAALGPNVAGVTQNSATSMLILNGTNTYAGNTTVNAGTLRITKINPGNDASTVTIAATGATLDLTYTGTDKVDKLFIGTTRMADGVYGRSGSLTPVIPIPQITGNGTLTVVAAGFSSWITGTFATGQVPADKQGPNDDPDNDGIRNLIEYAIAGQDPTLPNPSLGSFIDNTLSFTKRADTSGLTYAIEKSTDLGIIDAWAQPPPGGSYVNTTDTISFTLTPGTPSRNFLRLHVRSN